MWKSPWPRWGVVLGFALGGFFDGILLHQILQWHHLLSLVPGLADIRLQVLWDGYFHALMYGVAAAGLWGLWRTRRRAGEAGSGHLAAALLVGFGAWHVIDGILSHWILGIHRIKLDSDTPLLWDLAWLLAFGVGPVAAGWRLARRGGAAPRAGGGTVVLLLLTVGAVGAGAWSLRPPPGQDFATVVFRPDMGPPRVLAALAATDARLVWSDPSMGVVVLDIAPARRLGLYAHGAMLVSGTGMPAGCFGWSRP